ncbi:MAG: hypothetical protein JO089_04185, partial [Alphaproteobacteria bacterium]|nr:hypothetical protein [Alphaproteobacteria bacterium]
MTDTPLTGGEAAKKAEADRVLSAGEKAAQGPARGMLDQLSHSLQQSFTDPQTGGLDFKKLAFVGGIGTLGTAVGVTMGIAPMVIIGGGSLIGAYLGADALFNLLGWRDAAKLTPPPLPKPVGLKPAEGYNSTTDMNVPGKGEV